MQCFSFVKTYIGIIPGGRETSFVGRNTTFRGGRTVRVRGTFKDAQPNV
jgi:hypothetical protein